MWLQHIENRDNESNEKWLSNDKQYNVFQSKVIWIIWYTQIVIEK